MRRGTVAVIAGVALVLAYTGARILPLGIAGLCLAVLGVSLILTEARSLATIAMTGYLARLTDTFTASEGVAALRAAARQRFDRVLLQATRYRFIVGWVMRDSLIRHKNRIAVAAGLHAIGLTAQGIALSAALIYARSIESGDTIRIPLIARVYSPREDITLLFLVVVAVIVLLLIASFTFYEARRRSMDIGRSYEEFCSRRILALGTQLPHPAAPHASDGIGKRRISELLRDCRYCGRSLMIMINSLRDFPIVLVAGIGIFLADARLSLIVLALLGVSSLFLYRVNIQGVAESQRLERAAVDAAAERREILKRIQETAAPLDEEDAGFLRMYERGAAKRYLDAWVGRLGVPQSSGLVTQSLFAVSVGAILAVQGAAILSGSTNWSALLVYLLALRYFLTYVTKVGRTITSLNRFFPQLQRHFLFVNEAHDLPSPTDAPLPSFNVTPRVPPLHKSVAPRTGTPGVMIGILSPFPYSRFDLSKVWAALNISPSKQADEICARTRVLGGALSPGVSIRKGFDIHQGTTSTELDELLTQLLSEPPSIDLDRPMRAAAIEGLDREVKSALAIAAAAKWTGGLLLVRDSWLRDLPVSREAALDLLKHHLILYNSTSVATFSPSIDTDIVFVADASKIVGWSSVEWLTQNREQVLALMGREHTETGDERSDDLLLDEGDIDEDMDDDFL